MNKIKSHIGVLNSWGNYQKIRSKLYTIFDTTKSIDLKDNNYIVYANGRSYGDCALNETAVLTNKLNKILSFDAQKGIIQCQSGVLLSEIIKKIVPKKWFLPVTPGTKYITVGGAVAADVHGKNHHNAGCFSNFVINLKLMLPNGTILTCSRTENTTLFRATCAGMGLTGIITEITIQLKKIKSTLIEQKTITTLNLKETFKVFETYKEATYLVTWIDGLATKKIGKGVSFIGEHATDNYSNLTFSKKISIPKLFPSFVLNSISIKLYNFFYFRKQKETLGRVTLDRFFYPLDSIRNWNRIYGKKGFIQYQIVIPKSNGYQAIFKLLQEVKKSKHVSYLTILKLLGEENENYLSFPLEGYTLAMDFKIKEGLWSFLDHLDSVVLEFNGRAYLAKDGRMSEEFFKNGYPKLTVMKKIRKKYKLEKLQSMQSKRLGL